MLGVLTFGAADQGLALDLLGFPFISLTLLFVTSCNPLGGRGLRSECAEQVLPDGEGMALDALCLIERPLVAGFGLEDDGAGVGAMGQNGDHGEQHGDDSGERAIFLTGGIALGPFPMDL